MDIINTNGRSAGLHPSVFKKSFSPMEVRELEKTGKDLSKPTPTERKVVNKGATVTAKEVATGEYLACLFLLPANDERHGPLKTQVDKHFLVEEQEHPINILEAKRLMTGSAQEPVSRSTSVRRGVCWMWIL